MEYECSESCSLFKSLICGIEDKHLTNGYKNCPCKQCILKVVCITQCQERHDMVVTFGALLRRSDVSTLL